MGGKLLVWGGALFLVRYKLRQLQIHRVDVDAEEKKVSLRVCSVNSDPGAAAFPADARLVAAKEVQDTELATRYPVLVFQAAQASRGSGAPKRRRSTEDAKAIAADDEVESTRLRPGRRLIFYVLYKMGGGEIGLRFLNDLEVPVRTKASGQDTAATGDANGLELQIFLTDGPYVLLFERCSELATLLSLQREKRENGGSEFYVWLEQVDVSCGTKNDTSAPIQVVSCTYVSVTHSVSPHILIHAQSSSSAIDGDRHVWSVVQEEIERGERMAKEDGILSEQEQITCSCFISQLSEWEFEASPSDDMASLTSWERGNETSPARAETCVSTLLVTGTTNNTVYVYTNGILLASFVLLVRPAEVWCMSEDNMDQYYVLGVRCDDANRSFYMLGFSSSVQHPSMELLLSFNHVGHAYVGDFAETGVSPSTQVLLLNDVLGILGPNICSDAKERGVDECLDDRQLVKRSVLITQKPAAHETRLSCHRLRLRDQNKSNHGSRSRKRSRNEKVTSKGDSTDFKPQSFSYIERTQKDSSRDRSMKHPDMHADGAENVLAASHAQLGKLADSLAARLKTGQQELERLQIIVNDKIELTCQLNQLIMQLYRKQAASSSEDNYLLTSLVSIQEVESSHSAGLDFIDMETVVGAPPTSIISNVNADEKSLSSMARELQLEQQVTLELFRIVEYVPSSSLIRAEVILKNLSGIMLENSYVALTAPNGEPTCTRGWTCSCSVIPEFRPAASVNEKGSGKARFQLEIQFAPSFTFLRVRKVLKAMLWLHWSAHRKQSCSVVTQIPRINFFSLAVASVKVSPDGLLGVSNAPLTTVDCNGGYASSQQEQLLFISSGSNLASWFGNSRYRILSLVSSIVRPTFALVNLDVRERELMLYELSRMVTNLPSDVYVMHNPFQRQHLRALQLVLCGMRQEIQAFQQSNSVADQDRMTSENGARSTLRKQISKAEHHSPASIRRAMQRDTDLQVHQLLQALQNRVNFHTMWFDAANQ